MILYLNGNSKNNVSYFADLLEVNGRRYSLEGGSECSEGLNCKFKGDLYVEDGDDYLDLSDQQIKTLFDDLKNPKNEILISVLTLEDPEDNSELRELIETDEITDCKGTLCVGDEEIDFTFKAQY